MGKKRPDQVKRVHETLKKNAKEAKYGMPYCKWRKEDNRWEISDASGRDASMFFYPEGSVGLIKLPTTRSKTQATALHLGTHTVGTQVDPVAFIFGA